jgi:hypothetical protein
VLAAATARSHLEVGELLAISVAQTAVLMAIAVVVGQWATQKLGLGTPLKALLTCSPAPENTLSTLFIAFAPWCRHGASPDAARSLGFRLRRRTNHNVEKGSAKLNAW